MDQKATAFRVHVEALGAQGRVKECIEDGLRFLQHDLGLDLPRSYSKWRAMMVFFKTKGAISKVSEEELLRYHIATNPVHTTILSLLKTVVTFCFQSHLFDEAFILTMIGVQCILKFGLALEAGAILADYGIFLSIMGDFDAGYRSMEKLG